MEPNISNRSVLGLTQFILALMLGSVLTLVTIYFSPGTFKSFLGLKETVYVDKPVENIPKKVTLYLLDSKKYSTNGSAQWFTTAVRETTRTDVAAFAIEEIIKGPTSSEIQLGLEPTFSKSKFGYFDGSSNCDGKDFKISIENEKATLQFCRQTVLSGDMSGSVISQQIIETLKQFSTIKQVRVLNHSGYCFNDLSGKNTTECYE